jgi:predicted flap endonuclease-1-like 5' DNA nuclease
VSTSSRPPLRPSTASGRPAPVSSRPLTPSRASAPPSRPGDAALEQRVGKVRARLEILADRVEKLEKGESQGSDRMARDLIALKRDMVRVAALAERGGAVKDHLNRLSRRVDELTGGAKAKNDVVTLDARVSRLARESEDVRDRLADRIDRLEKTLGSVVTALDALTARVEALATASPATAAGVEAEPAAAAAPALDERVSTEGEGGADDLRKIKGIGPKFEKALHAAGVRRWAQIAAWSDDDIDAIADRIGVKGARIRKAGWVASAKALLDG